MRKQKFALNTIAAIVNQIIALICGFILPRQILLYYGSTVNGLVSSITQFLGFISLMDFGVGAVVQASLYKPLAEKDNKRISEVMYSANIFFKKIAIILVCYTCILMFFYPLVIDETNGLVSTAFLVGAIAVRSVAEYYFGITNKLLLQADQQAYIYLFPTAITNILNNIVAVGLIQLGFSINIVKFASAIILMICPIYMCYYVKTHYEIQKNIKLYYEPLKQKWSALSQHVASFVVDRTDVVVLTVMSSLANVSIYDVYHLVVFGLYQTYAVLVTGVQSLLGDMYVKNERDKLNQAFDVFEWGTHFFVTVVYGCTAVLIIPFVRIYTKGVSDVNYVVPAFSLLITAAYAVCCFFIFYNMVIKAAGHFKQTQRSATIEAMLNLIISIVLVHKFGLVGVALGTLIAKVYRVCYFIKYLQKNILYRNIMTFIKQILINAVCVITIYFSTSIWTLNDISYTSWIILAIKVSVLAVIETLFFNFIFKRRNIKSIGLLIKKKIIRIC